MMTIYSCSSFQAERLDQKKSDEAALKISDQWLQADTEKVISDVMIEMKEHVGLRRFLAQNGRDFKLLVGDVKNLTHEAYFPISELNEEFLNALSKSGDFILVESESRDQILRELTYQNDGMVDPASAKKIGKQVGADLIIFGNVYMKPETRDGKTIKQYSVNLRITDLEKGLEIFRSRVKLSKYSEQSKLGW